MAAVVAKSFLFLQFRSNLKPYETSKSDYIADFFPFSC